MNRHVLIFLLLSGFGLPCAQSKTPPTDEAGKTVAAFCENFYALHWTEAAAAMHSDALAEFKNLFVHIASTPKDEKDGQEFFQMFGVSSVQELQAMKPDACFVRFLSVLFPLFPKTTQQMWLGTKVQVIGSVAERDDLVHVVIRTTSEMQSAPLSVVSVVSVQRVGEGWQVLLTTEMQAVLNKMKR